MQSLDEGMDTMFHLGVVAAFLWQQGGDVHRGTWFLLAIAVALWLQAIGIVIAAAFAMKMFRKIVQVTDAFDRKTSPILEKSTLLVEELTPKLRAISTNVEQVSYTVREKVDELSATVAELNRTVSEANFMARVHVSRVNGMVEDALDTTQEVQATVQESIRKPVRQMAGIVAGVKAAIDTLIARSPLKPKGYENPYDL